MLLTLILPSPASIGVDSDGTVTKYEFFVSYTNNQSIVNLGNNQTGSFFTTLPAGSSTDSNKLYIFVQVFDNSGGITVYYISTPVVVVMTTTSLFQTQADILSGSSSNPSVKSMQSPDLSVASSSIIAYASSFNQMAVSAYLSPEQIETAKKVNAIFVQYLINFNLSDLSSIKAASSVLSLCE